ncbi:MAG: rRNA maturation RNase YbeY [Flavobacteriaceae bacterium]|nr:rRNA maturation RNase YbeY [Flavobacteriaceae bacterium]|tara:strand:- start:10133 stop:10555 length:423 start_codon:yes stop_codon:yes gene_type:complete
MPLEFIYNTDYTLTDEKLHSAWIKSAIFSENYDLGNIVFAFFNDEEVKKLNKKFLNKDYYTDVISFNETNDKIISGNIAISVDRVKENSKKFKCTFQDEMRRVMIHGLLHFMGYNDQNNEASAKMRKKENEKIKMFHVEP